MLFELWATQLEWVLSLFNRMLPTTPFHSLSTVRPWLSETNYREQVSLFCCIVSLPSVPETPVQLCPTELRSSRLSAKSWYPLKLPTYLMWQTLIATSERFFIRYCTVLQNLTLPRSKFSWEDAATESCQGRAATRDGCAVTITRRQLILPLNTLICSHLLCSPGQVLLFINHAVNEWLKNR